MQGERQRRAAGSEGEIESQGQRPRHVRPYAAAVGIAGGAALG
jgi:hypothetical protein